LTGERGDWAIRIDTGSTWVITTDGGSLISDWTELATPSSAVTSVNGFTGTVVLGPSDVGAATAAQGTTADTALQPGDNISELTNDSAYVILPPNPKRGDILVWDDGLIWLSGIVTTLPIRTTEIIGLTEQTGRTYSDDTSQYGDIKYLQYLANPFDGSITTGVRVESSNNAAGVIYTFNPPINCTTLRLHVRGMGQGQWSAYIYPSINGVEQAGGYITWTANEWLTDPSWSGPITSIKVEHNAGGTENIRSCYWDAMEVDGVILQNSLDVTVLTFSDYDELEKLQYNDPVTQDNSTPQVGGMEPRGIVEAVDLVNKEVTIREVVGTWGPANTGRSLYGPEVPV
jgi:hypothetical protein